MIKKRPVNLSLFSLSFPMPAIVSILHRLTGVFLFLCAPFLVWVLHTSLMTPEGFDQVASFFSFFPVKAIVWVLMVALFGHTVAGIRHLFMDIGVGETLRGGRATAWGVLGLSILFALAAGIWLW